MNSKTMEGLVGARTNMNLMNTPMRVYKEARRRGDTSAMERAMGYAGEYVGRAEKYKAEAYKGMEEDAKEAREKAESEREKAIEKRRKEREKIEARIEESKENKTDTAAISEEGKVLSKDTVGSDVENPVKVSAGENKEPVIYSKTGAVSQPEQESNISISI